MKLRRKLTLSLDHCALVTLPPAWCCSTLWPWQWLSQCCSCCGEGRWISHSEQRPWHSPTDNSSWEGVSTSTPFGHTHFSWVHNVTDGVQTQVSCSPEESISPLSQSLGIGSGRQFNDSGHRLIYKMLGTTLTSLKDFLRVTFRLREAWGSLGCTSSEEPSSCLFVRLALLSGNYEEKENREKDRSHNSQCYNIVTYLHQISWYLRW